MANEEKALHDEYPVVVSKMDPLIIRVSETVLLVGSTSYTAKIKISQLFSGFYIYVSSLGTPIYTEKVNIGEYSIEGDNNRSEGSDAWNYVEEKACAWIDALEESMETSDTSKNIVDLLRESKYQEHFDLSGHIIDEHYKEKYGDNFELCTEKPTYLEILAEQLKLITGKNISPYDVTNSVLYQAISEPIAEAIESGLNSLVSQMSAMKADIEVMQSDITSMQSDITSIKSDVGSVNTTTSTILNDTDYGIPSIKTAISDSTSSIKGTFDYEYTASISDCYNIIKRLQNTEDATIRKINDIYQAYGFGNTDPTGWFVFSKTYPST